LADWFDKYGDLLGQGAPEARVPDLTPKLRAVLALLPQNRRSAKDWEIASRLPVGTFYYCRDVLVQRGFVRREGSGRGAPFRRVEALPKEQRRVA
jgi:hypothetical protein